MAGLIRVLVLVLAIGFVAWLLLRFFTGSRLKCATCRHCRKLMRDGSICGYGSRETFKTIVHIENCWDYEYEDRGSRSR